MFPVFLYIPSGGVEWCQEDIKLDIQLAWSSWCKRVVRAVEGKFTCFLYISDVLLFCVLHIH